MEGFDVFSYHHILNSSIIKPARAIRLSLRTSPALRTSPLHPVRRLARPPADSPRRTMPLLRNLSSARQSRSPSRQSALSSAPAAYGIRLASRRPLRSLAIFPAPLPSSPRRSPTLPSESPLKPCLLRPHRRPGRRRRGPPPPPPASPRTQPPRASAVVSVAPAAALPSPPGSRDPRTLPPPDSRDPPRAAAEGLRRPPTAARPSTPRPPRSSAAAAEVLRRRAPGRSRAQEAQRGRRPPPVSAFQAAAAPA